MDGAHRRRGPPLASKSSSCRERAPGSTAAGETVCTNLPAAQPTNDREPRERRVSPIGVAEEGGERQRTNWGQERWLSALGASLERACARPHGAPDWRGGADSCVYGGGGGEWVKGGSVNRAKAVSRPSCRLRATLEEPRWRWKTSRSSDAGRWRLGEPRLDDSIPLSALLWGEILRRFRCSYCPLT